jgi:hypothetical protein
MAGRTIRIFLPDGTPQGFRVAEVGMWTGIGLVCPRAELARLGKHSKSHGTGIYLLVGEAEGTTLGQRVYVGEGDDVWERVRAHDLDPDKEFWNWVVAFVSKDNNLTKAHGRWLEAKLVREIVAARRVELANGNGPGGGELPDPDVADMETFLENVRMLLPVLGLDAFGVEAPQVLAPTDLELTLKWEGATAECTVHEGQFVVRKGSSARVKEVESLSENYRDLRRKLRDAGVLTPSTSDLLAFTVDYAFDSPTAAAVAVTGTVVNGRTVWKVKGTGIPYKEWQQAQAGEGGA